MLIDWFTVGAQVINFLILVWLLKRFLYKPILTAIDAREGLIAQQLADSQARMAAASKAETSVQGKLAECDAQHALLMERATEEAHRERLRLIDAAQHEADRVAALRQEALAADAHALTQALMTKTQKRAFAIARKTLTDLGGTSLDERMCAVFMHQISILDGEPRERLITALATTTEPILIRTAFPLSAQQQTLLRESIHAMVAVPAPIQHVVDPDLIAGIELTCNGQKVSWSIAHHLATLASDVDELLKAQCRSSIIPALASP